MKKKEEAKTFLDKIMLDFKNITLMSIALNVLFLFFAIFVYLNPIVTEEVAGVIIGVYFLLFGVLAIYEFLTRKINPMYSFRIFAGVLLLVLGAFTIVQPLKITKMLTFTLGIYLIIVAVFKVLDALKLKKCKYEAWMIVLVTSIILFILGVFIAINPMSSMYLIEAAALFIILSSILEIANLLMFYSKSKEIVKLIKKAK